MPQKVYLDDQGNPIQTAGSPAGKPVTKTKKTYLDNRGNPLPGDFIPISAAQAQARFSPPLTWAQQARNTMLNALPAAGGVLGAAAGLPLAPATGGLSSVGSAAIGTGGGEALRSLLETGLRAANDVEPQNPNDVASGILSQFLGGAAAEVLGQATAPVVNQVAGRAITKANPFVDRIKERAKEYYGLAMSPSGKNAKVYAMEAAADMADKTYAPFTKRGFLARTTEEALRSGRNVEMELSKLAERDAAERAAIGTWPMPSQQNPQYPTTFETRPGDPDHELLGDFLQGKLLTAEIAEMDRAAALNAQRGFWAGDETIPFEAMGPWPTGTAAHPGPLPSATASQMTIWAPGSVPTQQTPHYMDEMTAKLAAKNPDIVPIINAMRDWRNQAIIRDTDGLVVNPAQYRNMDEHVNLMEQLAAQQGRFPKPSSLIDARQKLDAQAGTAFTSNAADASAAQANLAAGNAIRQELRSKAPELAAANQQNHLDIIRRTLAEDRQLADFGRTTNAAREFMGARYGLGNLIAGAGAGGAAGGYYTDSKEGALKGALMGAALVGGASKLADLVNSPLWYSLNAATRSIIARGLEQKWAPETIATAIRLANAPSTAIPDNPQNENQPTHSPVKAIQPTPPGLASWFVGR